MKRYLLAGVAAFGLATGAAGAAEAAGWNGFTVAAGGGYGAWAADTTTLDHGTSTCDLCVPTKQGGSGGLGSVAVGFDHQIGASKFVAGVFVDGDLASIQGDVQDQGPFNVGHETETSAISEGVRLGWIVSPMMLPYVDVGASQAHFKGGAMVDNCCGSTSGSATGYTVSSANRSGFFVGAGVETKINAHWSWKVEYRYADFGKAVLTDADGASYDDDISFHPIVQTARAELAFRF